MLDTLPEFQTALDRWLELAAERTGLQALFNHLKRHSLRKLWEDYVLVFDRNRRHVLYIFEYAYDEDHDRGSAVMDPLEKYHRYGFELGDNELSGYLPVLLEFLSHVPPIDAQGLLGGAVYAVARIVENPQSHDPPYAAVLKVAVAFNPVASQPLTKPPVRDMDEVMETSDPDWRGTESLLKPSMQTVRFYPKGRH